MFKTFGDNVNQTKLEHMKAQMAAFKDNLSKFAIKHRRGIPCSRLTKQNNKAAGSPVTHKHPPSGPSIDVWNLLRGGEGKRKNFTQEVGLKCLFLTVWAMPENKQPEMPVSSMK